MVMSPEQWMAANPGPITPVNTQNNSTIPSPEQWMVNNPVLPVGPAVGEARAAARRPIP